MLEVEQLGFYAIESEHLGRRWPPLPLSETMRQLAAVVGLQRQAGRETFLVVATTEDEHQLRSLINAVAVDPLVVICLTAPAEVVARRVAEREPDTSPGKASLVDHARPLANEIPAISGIDVIIPTAERNAVGVAIEVRDVLSARGILQRA